MIKFLFISFILCSVQISISQNLVSPPLGSSIQPVSEGSTVFDLIAFGENVEWFSDLDCPISTISTTSYDAFPILIQTLSNKIIMIYRKGSAHVGNDGVMVMRTSIDEAKTFTEPSVILYEEGVDIRNASGGVTPTGRIVLFFMKYNAINAKSISHGYVYSDDDGNSWSSYVEIEKYLHSFYSPYGQILEIGDGKIMVPWYGETGNTDFSTYIKISIDDGKTWDESVLVANSSTVRYGESSYAYLGNNTIIGLIRNSTGGTSFYQVMSNDNGKTWTDQGIVNFDVTALVSPFLSTYLDDNGEKNVIAFYANRTNKKMSSVTGKSSELIKGVSGWNINSKTELGNHTTTDFGYPAVINLKGRKKFMGIYYKAFSKSVANINFFNFTPHYNSTDSPKTGSVPLATTTALLNDVVYYASQTINKVRSSERLAVTVKINNLSLPQNIFQNFDYYIDPLNAILTITSVYKMDEIALLSNTGQSMLNLQKQGLKAEIDLSSFSKGVYFVNIKANGKYNAIKIIK